MVNKKQGILIFGIWSIGMGAAVGATCWAALRVMDAGIELVWKWLPEVLGIASHSMIGGDNCGSLAYDLGVCLIGALLIGLWQKRNGILPESLEEVLGKVKKNGGYPYDRIRILLVSALLVLIFGGTVGPEAGLTGVIAGLCTRIGDKLKYKGDRAKSMAEAGMAATLGIVFGAPLYGICENLEEKDWAQGRRYAPAEDRERILSGKERTLIYVMSVGGGLAAFKGLSMLLGGSAGLPRFDRSRELDPTVLIGQWKWGLLLILVGIAAALVYIVFNRITACLGGKLIDHRVVSCLIAGILIGVIGHYVSAGRFSGEAQMELLMENWRGMTIGALLMLGVIKLLMVNVSVNLGWKGGTIFPMIYSAVSVGYAMAAAIGTVEGTFAVAVVAAAMLGFLMRKPVTVVAILLLCFPLTFLPALLIASFVSAWLGKKIGSRIKARSGASAAN